MKTWTWILVGGGAFTMLAGYLSARAKAQSLAATLPAGVVVPPGTPLTAADIQTIVATGGQAIGDTNNILVSFNQYRSNFTAWAAQMGTTYHGQTVANTPRGMTFTQFVAMFH